LCRSRPPHNWTFAGSDEGGRRAASIYTLVETCKLNNVDRKAWLADVLARLPDHPAKRIGRVAALELEGEPDHTRCVIAVATRDLRSEWRRRS
jgi:hypothetical protein